MHMIFVRDKVLNVWEFFYGNTTGITNQERWYESWKIMLDVSVEAKIDVTEVVVVWLYLLCNNCLMLYFK